MATIDRPTEHGAAAPITASGTASSAASRLPLAQDPARQAFLVLRGAFVIAPIVFGLDKFTNWLASTTSRCVTSVCCWQPSRSSVWQRAMTRGRSPGPCTEVES